MNLRYHSCTDSFYDASDNLYTEPGESLDKLELKLAEAVEKLKSIKNVNNIEKDSLNIAVLQHNLCSYIETLEWKIDLKLLYLENGHK